MKDCPTVETLGIIAGNRSLPLLLAREARAQGVARLVAVAVDEETDPTLADLVDHVTWLKVGQLGKLIDCFKREGVRHCVMAGQVAPKNLFDLRPDMRAMKLLWGLKEKNAHTIFGAIARELNREGIELIEATPWLRRIMPGAGFQIGAELTEAQREDAVFGFGIAKEVARLEIGQTVVVKDGTVLAVEGFEGTDACLRRGGQLAGKKGGAMAVKVAREGHDMRFDIPCVGARTLEVMVESGISAMVLEAGSSLVMDREEWESGCRKHGMTLMTYGGEPLLEP